MIKTQIQLPDELYERTKAFAKAREWSLAETFRRAVEQLMDRYPDDPSPATEDWQPPTSAACGWNDLSPEELKEILHNDMDPILP